MISKQLKGCLEQVRKILRNFKGNKNMSWDENRRLKLTFLREAPQKQNAIVEFEIADNQRVNFQKALEYVIAAMINAEGDVKTMLETTDSETGKPTMLDIQIRGDQQKLVGILHQSMNELKSYSVRSR
jgi:hypothetical protein